VSARENDARIVEIGGQLFRTVGNATPTPP
jgi:hypothetical protein